ncbi:NifU family protein [Amycolatopsis rhizosphaerae]|uniref:NifU family protein n=1 Tax=Amycolatopsis rhizosphaerae TaxID=2053003 RepID=A0A558BNX7_9PSEU|nr:NifU family protein [Amycolatopsis rhizosphaerae]TVT38214.1 NifU family protein [Amycolatopsis rhizosphaerae]
MDVHEAGERIERILSELDTSADPAVRERAGELVRTLLEFHGAALARMTELLADSGEVLAALASDELVGGLLVLHGLHPVEVDERVTAALEHVRPYLGSHAGDVELLGIETGGEGEGVARLRLTGTCDGCPSSAETVKQAIERAIRAAAPEIGAIEVEGMVPAGAAAGRTLLPVVTLDCPVPREAS